MLRLLDILRLRGDKVTLALEQELFSSLSAEERMLLAPLVHGSAGCSTLAGGFRHPQARLAVTIAEHGALHRWAVYEDEASSLLLRGDTRDALGMRRKLSQKDLIPSSTAGSDIVLIADNEKTAVAEFGEWIWGKLRKSLAEKLGKDFIASREPIARITFSDRYCNSPLTVTLLHNMLRHLKDSYGDAWTSPACLINFANYTNNYTNNYSSFRVSGNWMNENARNDAVKQLLCDFGKVFVKAMHKKYLPHARCLQLDFRDGSMLKIWFDQGLGFLNVDDRDPGRQFPFHESCVDQVKKMQTMNQRLKVVNGGTVISIQKGMTKDARQ